MLNGKELRQRLGVQNSLAEFQPRNSLLVQRESRAAANEDNEPWMLDGWDVVTSPARKGVPRALGNVRDVSPDRYPPSWRASRAENEDTWPASRSRSASTHRSASRRSAPPRPRSPIPFYHNCYGRPSLASRSMTPPRLRPQSPRRMQDSGPYRSSSPWRERLAKGSGKPDFARERGAALRNNITHPALYVSESFRSPSPSPALRDPSFQWMHEGRLDLRTPSIPDLVDTIGLPGSGPGMNTQRRSPSGLDSECMVSVHECRLDLRTPPTAPECMANGHVRGTVAFSGLGHTPDSGWRWGPGWSEPEWAAAPRFPAAREGRFGTRERGQVRFSPRQRAREECARDIFPFF